MVGPNSAQVVLGQRQLLGGGAQVRREHVLVGGVDDGGLDGPAEQRLRVGDEVGVERVVAGDEHAEGVAVTSAGPADLLPQRGAGAGEPRHHHRVEPADVDAQLERVGRGQPDQLAGAQGPLDRAALLGQVAAAVGRDLAGQRRVDLGEQLGGGEGDLLGPAPRPDERQRADPLDHQVGQQVGGLGRRGAPHRGAVLAGAGRERRLPERDGDLAAGRAVVDDRDEVEAGEPVGVDLRLGDRGRGEHERRVGAVRRAHAPQPAQHLGHVGPEHAPVVVALVDHDVAQRPEELRPAVVGGQQGAVQHVGVGQHVLGVVARPVPLLARAVAVVGGDPQVEPQRLQAGQLVLGERLGRAEVEGGGAPLLARPAGGADVGQRRQLVAQRLARGRAGRHHDVAAGVRRLGGLDLVPPRGAHAAGLERRPDVVGHPGRPRRLDRRPRRQHLEVGQPVLAAGHRRRGARPRRASRRGRRSRCVHASILPSGADIGRGPGPRAFATPVPRTAYYFHERRDGVV